jgi:hypothetical protein
MKKIPVWPAHTVSWLKVAKFKDGSVRWIGDLKLLEPLLEQLKARAETTEAAMRKATDEIFALSEEKPDGR